ncbi:MAG: GAF domain-containing sensor histidine kinase [Bacteroidota bacterium]|jgi:c-di-GMP phosphodiesterase
MADKFSNIKIREPRASKQVKIGSELKPEIIIDLIAKWQSMLDLIAKLIDVPSVLIMKLNEDTIEVFIKSQTEGNPYKAGEKAKLGFGLYCETVIGTQKKLLVPDATRSPIWKDDNPDIDLGMISYLGYPVNWPDGEVFGTICILDNKSNHYTKTVEDLIDQVKQNLETDLTMLVYQQELLENNIQLKELNSVRNKFFSIIAHDLRSPFSSLLGLTELMEKELPIMDKDQIQKSAVTLRQSAKNLYGLLENLLEWSLLQQNLTTANPELFPLMPKVNSSLNSVRDSANKKGIEIITDIPDDLMVYADEQMLDGILRNLSANAVKFTPKGGKIAIAAKAGFDNWVEVSVKDTGIGMTREMADNLFNKDVNTSRRGTEKEPSTGLGLIICKEFVEKQAGKLWVDSEEEKGSTFYFTLPNRKDETITIEKKELNLCQ